MSEDSNEKVKQDAVVHPVPEVKPEPPKVQPEPPKPAPAPPKAPEPPKQEPIPREVLQRMGVHLRKAERLKITQDQAEAKILNDPEVRAKYEKLRKSGKF